MGIEARMARMLGMFGVVVLGMLLLPAMALAQSGSLAGFGIVMVHGKGGRPLGPTKPLADALEAEGARVVSPRMAWAGTANVPARAPSRRNILICALCPDLARVWAKRRAAASALAPLMKIISLSNRSDSTDQPSPTGLTEIIRSMTLTP